MSDLPPAENDRVPELPRPKKSTRTKTEKKKKPKHESRYHVVLWNDDEYSFDYVIAMLRILFGYPAEKGRQLADEVDQAGRAVVFTSSLEKAEIKRDQILGFGREKNAARPLIATLERDRED